jgi:hypothetical protein
LPFFFFFYPYHLGIHLPSHTHKWLQDRSLLPTCFLHCSMSVSPLYLKPCPFLLSNSKFLTDLKNTRTGTLCLIPSPQTPSTWTWIWWVWQR